MKNNFPLATVVLLASAPIWVVGCYTPQSYAKKAYESAVIQKTTSYKCDEGESFNVTYGFSQKGSPTYAQAYLNGKIRFMPIKLKNTDTAITTFGDDDNFRLITDSITGKNIQVQSPSNEIIYKSCIPL